MTSRLAELEHRLVAGFGRFIDAPMYGPYILDPLTGRPGGVAPVNVSETFLARYERLPQGRRTNPLHAHALRRDRSWIPGAARMERWWSRAVATGGNRSQRRTGELL